MSDLKSIFKGQPKLISVDQAAELVASTRATIYDWHHRPERYEIPDDMFVKFGRRVLIKTAVLEKWFISRCA